MVPTVTQHLLVMQDTMQRFVLPSIPPQERFALEQAGLIMASLGWLADVNESQYLMEAQEQNDLLSLARSLLGLEFADDDARAQLQDLVADAPGPDASVADLRARSRELKSLTARALDTLSEADQRSGVAMFAQASARLIAREQAYGRMTGLVRHPEGALNEVLATQRPTREDNINGIA